MALRILMKAETQMSWRVAIGGGSRKRGEQRKEGEREGEGEPWVAK